MDISPSIIEVQARSPGAEVGTCPTSQVVPRRRSFGQVRGSKLEKPEVHSLEHIEGLYKLSTTQMVADRSPP